jgi:cytochrome c5
MFQSLLHISSVILSSVILFEVAATPMPAPKLPQEAAPPPAASSTVKNPVKPTSESQAKAKKTYGFDCEMCHAANGNGKTDLATSMSMTLSDLSDPKTLAGKSDGDLFDIIRKGAGKMPPEEAARAKDDDVWNLVIYIRSLAKGGATNTASANR